MTYAAVLAAVLSVAACSGGDPAPTPSATSPVTTGTTTAPTGTPPATSTTTASPPPATPTSTGPAFPAGVPAAARQKTNEGAKAFVAHFVQRLNKSWTAPDAGAIEPLCLSQYQACGGYLATARDLEAKSQRYDGDPLSVSALVPLTPEEGRQGILMVGTQERRSVVTESGEVVLTDPRKPLRIAFQLAWTNAGWKIYSSKLVVS